MGAADAVPGISGGTIALLLGIYEELISTIGNINLSLFKDLKEHGINSFWKKINGNFLFLKKYLASLYHALSNEGSVCTAL